MNKTHCDLCDEVYEERGWEIELNGEKRLVKVSFLKKTGDYCQETDIDMCKSCFVKGVNNGFVFGKKGVE